MWSVRVVRRLARVSHHYGARVQGIETDESATPATPQDGGAAGTPRNRAVVRVAVLALVAALLTVAVGTAVMVASYWRPEPAAAPAPRSPLIQPTPAPEVRDPLPTVFGGTVAEVVANGEAVGATLIVFDARWNRPVEPDWQVCTRGETFIGSEGIPSGELHVAAVPPGDPCP
jgi:hypothetical protein